LVERTTIAGETEVLGENLPQRHFVPPQIPHDQEKSTLQNSFSFSYFSRFLSDMHKAKYIPNHV
jgi:hypothetical protein